MPSALQCFETKLDTRLEELHTNYGSSIIAALLENPQTHEAGAKPELPPYPLAKMNLGHAVYYRDESLVHVEVTNSGKGGSV